MSEYYCRQQRADRNHNHTDYFRTVLFKEFFQEHQNKSGHHGGDYLSLVADHLHLEKSEIPHRDLCGCSYAEAVQQLGRHQGQAQNNSQNLGSSHLFGNGPADTHRQHMEDRLSDEPEETVHAGPELGNIRQGQSSVFKKADLADHVPEAQNQTAADQSRIQRGENLSQGSHTFLQGLLIGFCRGFHRFLADSLDARVSRKLIVKHTYIVADDHLELACLGKSSFHAFDLLNSFFIRLPRIHQNNAHPGHTVGDCADILFSSHSRQQLSDVFRILSHVPFLLLYMFKQVLCI